MWAFDLKHGACSRGAPGAYCCHSPQVEVTCSDTIQELVSHANRARSTGSTGVNEDSSRSHSIMQVCPQVTQYLLHPMSCPVRKA